MYARLTFLRVAAPRLGRREALLSLLAAVATVLLLAQARRAWPELTDLSLAWFGTPAAALMLVAASGPRRSEHLVAGAWAWGLAGLFGLALWHAGMRSTLQMPQCAVWIALCLLELMRHRRATPGLLALGVVVLATLGASVEMGWQTPWQAGSGVAIGALAARWASGPLARVTARVAAAAGGPAGASLVAAGLLTLAAAVTVTETTSLGPAAPNRTLAALGLLAALRWACWAGGPRARR